ncbi:MAG: CHASE3 domain-containing protein [Hyphomicrobium sp.]
MSGVAAKVRRSSGLFALSSVPILGILSASLRNSIVRPDAALVSRSLEVKTKLSTLLRAARNIETGKRDFVITGNPEIPEYSTAAAKSITATRLKVVALASDNPRQAALLKALQPMFAEPIAAAVAGAGLRNAHGPTEASSGIDEHDGMAPITNLRNAIGDAQNPEDPLLAMRVAALELRRTWLFAAYLCRCWRR